MKPRVTVMVHTHSETPIECHVDTVDKRAVLHIGDMVDPPVTIFLDEPDLVRLLTVLADAAREVAQ